MATTTIVEKGIVEANPVDQISFTLKSLEFDSQLTITTKSGDRKIIHLPDNYRIEKNDETYKVIFNKKDDYTDSFGIMIYPILIVSKMETEEETEESTDPPSNAVQGTQVHPSPKFQISYAGEKPLWGRIFNVKDLQ